MTPLKLNLQSMKKVKEDEKSATFRHPKGHEIVIAKASLPAIHKKQISELPLHLADGTPDEPVSGPAPLDLDFHPDQPIEITPQNSAEAHLRDEAALNKDLIEAKNKWGMRNPDESTAPEDIQKRAMSQATDAALWKKESEDMDKPDPKALEAEHYQSNLNYIRHENDKRQKLGIPTLPLPVPPPGLYQSAAQAQPEPQREMASSNVQPQGGGAPGLPNDIQGDFHLGQKAILQQRDIDAQKAQAGARETGADLAAQANENWNFQKDMEKDRAQEQAVLQDIKDGHINPNHFVESKDSWQKAGQAISLFLGGLSTAFTGGPNPALEFLNKQIERDIDSQKDNLNQKKTLYGALRERHQDDITAHNQTLINMRNIYGQRMLLQAEQSGNPQAIASANMALAKWGIENEALRRQDAVRTLTMQKLKGGGAGLDAIDAVNAGIIPKEYQADAYKEQQSIDAQKSAVQGVHKLFADLDKEQSLGNRLSNPIQSSRKIDILKSELVNTVMNSSASKRLTRESIEQEIDPLMTHLRDGKETRATAVQAVANMIQKHADPTPLMDHFNLSPKGLYDAPHPQEGKTASDGNGNKLIMRNGKWTPLK